MVLFLNKILQKNNKNLFLILRNHCLYRQQIQNKKFKSKIQKQRIDVWFNEQDRKNLQYYLLEKIEFSPHGDFIAYLQSQHIWLYKLSAPDFGEVLRSTFKCQLVFSFHPTLPFIYCLQDKIVKIYMIFDSFQIQTLTIEDEIGVRALSNDENLFAYFDQQNQIKIYDRKQQKILVNLQSLKNINYLTFSIKESMIISQNVQKELQIWNIQDIYNVTSLNLPAQISQGVICVEFSQDEKLLVCGTDDQKVYFCSMEQNQIIHILENFDHNITAITFSPNNQMLSFGLYDGSILLYSFNYKQFDALSQYFDKNFQLNYYLKPVCCKIFGRSPQLLAFNCLLNQNSKIQTQNQQSLLQVFKQKEAILENDCQNEQVQK